MKISVIAVLVPVACLLSACTTPVQPAFKDIGTRTDSCIAGGPDEVAQQFYDLRIKNGMRGLPNNSALTQYRPYLSQQLYHTLQTAQSYQAKNPGENASYLRGDLFSSNSNGASSVEVSSASQIPNTDARNIPLRMKLTQSGQSWQDEALMIREGTCWTLDDVRYLGGTAYAPAGTLRQSLESR